MPGKKAGNLLLKTIENKGLQVERQDTAKRGF